MNAVCKTSSMLAAAVLTFAAQVALAVNVANPVNNAAVQPVGHVFFGNTFGGGSNKINDDSSATNDYTIGNGYFGYDFGRVTDVTSITIEQQNDGGRNRIQNFDVYTSSGKQSFTLPANQDAAQTISLGSTIHTGFLFIKPTSEYVNGGDSNKGIRELSVEGILDHSFTNVALGTPVTLSGWVVNPFGNANTAPTRVTQSTAGVVTDGTMVSGAGDYGDGVWAAGLGLDSSNNYIQVDLGSPISMQAFGLTQFNEGNGGRNMLSGLRLAFSNDNFTSTLTTLDFGALNQEGYLQRNFGSAITAQYVRLIGLSQYNNGDVNFGIQEFQLFNLTVPEPSGLALLFAGAVGLIVARRRSAKV